jgi:hypothetical protein
VSSGLGRGSTVKYYTNAGPRSGPILWWEHHDTIDVLRAYDDYAPIGMAMKVGRTEGGIAIWDLIIRGEVVPGRWIVLGREFLLKR